VRSAAGIGGVVVPLDDAVTGGFGSAVDAADAHRGPSGEAADRVKFFYGPVYRRRGARRRLFVTGAVPGNNQAGIPGERRIGVRVFTSHRCGIHVTWRSLPICRPTAHPIPGAYSSRQPKQEDRKMAIPRILVCAALATAFSTTLVAQMTPPTATGYHSISCIKVVPGKGRRLQQVHGRGCTQIRSVPRGLGAISAWLELRTVMPAGSEAGVRLRAGLVLSGPAQ